MSNSSNPIRVLTPDLTILGEFDDYESLQLVRRWNKYGEFTLYINKNKPGVEVFQKGNVILFDKTGKKSGYIKHRQIQLGDDGRASETLQIIGYTLGGVCATRLIIPPPGQTQDIVQVVPAEWAMKYYVDSHIVDPIDPKRKIDLVDTAVMHGLGPRITWFSRYGNLADELQSISISTGLGWNVTPDFEQKKWIFDVMQGRDLTVNNTDDNPPVIFSPEFDNVDDMTFTDSDMNYRNYGYVAGQGEGVDRAIVEVGSATGMDRLEVFIDARDVEDDSELPSRGQAKLLEFGQELSLEGKVMSTPSFTYEKDWDLGDYVTVQNREWGVTMDQQITVVQEIYEEDQLDIQVTFGAARPTLIDTLKREFNQMSGEIRR